MRMVASDRQESDNLDAKSYLKQPEKLDALIKNKLIEKQQWRDIALGITANMGGERVQSSGSKSKMSDALDKVVDMETEIDRLIDRYIDIKKDVVTTIEQLDIVMEYNIMHMRYIQYMSFQEIADHFGRDYTWATTAHGRALKSVQAILDKKEGEH